MVTDTPVMLRRDDPRSPPVAALIAFHLAEARGTTPAANAHAMDAAALADPAITLWSAWRGNALAGIAALRELAPGHGELKAMRTDPAHLRCGVATRLLSRIVGEARSRGYTRLSLETGTAPMFAAANRLYERHGFVDGAVFGGYPDSPHNRFMTLVF